MSFRIRRKYVSKWNNRSVDIVQYFGACSEEGETSADQAAYASRDLDVLGAGISSSGSEVTPGKEEEENGQRDEDEASCPVALWLPDGDGHGKREDSPQNEPPCSSNINSTSDGRHLTEGRKESEETPTQASMRWIKEQHIK